MTTQVVGVIPLAGASLSLLSNPGNIFSLSGNQLLASSTLPNGNYPLTIQAQGTGFSLVVADVLEWTGGSSSIDGPMDFSVPGNLPESPAGAAI